MDHFLLFSTIFCYPLSDFNVKTGTGFSVRDKRLFEISEVEITRVNCILFDVILPYLLFILFLFIYLFDLEIYIAS